MHRIDTLGSVSGKFDKGDPSVPRLPTRIDRRWANAVQEEICALIEGAGLTLRDSAADEAAGWGGQLLQAIRVMDPVKSAAVIKDSGGTVSVVGTPKNVASVSFVAAGGGAPNRIRVTFNTAVTNPRAQITFRREPTVGVFNAFAIPLIWSTTSTYVEFFGQVARFDISTAKWGIEDSGAFDLGDIAAQFDVVVIGD